MNKQCRFFCSECNTPVSEDDTVCSFCGADITKIEDDNFIYPKPAGFWIRVVAYLIDMLVFIPLIFVWLYNLYHIHSYALSLVLTIPNLIYQPYMESRYGATLGKMAVKIQVVDEQGLYLPLWRAYIRYLPMLFSIFITMISNYYLYNLLGSEHVSAAKVSAVKVISEFKDPLKILSDILNYFLVIDCITIIFNKRKRAIHDFWAESYCVRKVK